MSDRLSDHFELGEFVRSEIATRRDLDNTPSAEVVRNLRALCVNVLEPLRSAIGHGIQITSGYRSLAVNAAVGGAPSSDHQYGLAADIVAPPLTVDELADAVRALAPYVPLKQAIREFPPGGWLHVSVDLGASPKREFLVATREQGQTRYAAA